QGVATTLESVSDALISLVGLMLLGVCGLRLRSRLSADRDHHHHHDHDHHHGHSHGPSAHDMAHPVSLRSLAGIIVSIGIRPCSGAILIMLVAHVLRLRAAGIAAVLAMAVGTAITVAAVAILTIHARGALRRLASAEAEPSPWFGVAVDTIGAVA